MDLQLGPGTPDGRPMAAKFPTDQGDVLAAVITAGKPFILRATLHNGSAAPMLIKQFAVDVPDGWKSELFMDKLPKSIAAGDGCALTFRVTPPIDAQPTKAYFHRNDPDIDAIYKIDDPKYLTLALPPPPVWARVDYTINGADGEIRSVARTPMHDDKGEKWSMPLAVVPPFSVEALPATQILLAGANPSAQLSVGVRTTADRGNGVVRPEAPQGWKIEPQSADVSFTAPGQKSVEFKELPDGAKEARYEVRALLNADGRDYSDGYALVTRPDIGGFFYYQPALQRASIVDVKVPQGLKIGYIMGAGDDIPDVLRELGLNVTIVTPEELASGDLSRYGTIVLGIRAYDTRDDVKKNNQRLLDYAKNGGTLLVQYNTSPSDFNDGHLHALSRAAQPRSSYGRAGAGDDPRSAESRLPLSQSDYGARLRRLGAGARPVLHGSVGFALHAAAGVQRSRRAGAEGRSAAGAIRQGLLPLHGLRILPAAAVWRSGRDSSLCESAERRP